jgi:hypothetical protein
LETEWDHLQEWIERGSALVKESENKTALSAAPKQGEVLNWTLTSNLMGLFLGRELLVVLALRHGTHGGSRKK